MIDTIHLLPPASGPRSNPVLHGVAEAIAELFPPVVHRPETCDEEADEPFLPQTEEFAPERRAARG